MSPRRIFGLLLGRVTSEQLILACLLGGIVGCLPWDHTGAALIAICCSALLVLNASVPIFTTVVGVASLLALASYELVDRLGAALLAGPLSGLLALLAEAPLLAWAEWESNRVTGGLAFGLLLGLLLGTLLSQLVQRVRRRLATLEEGSDAFRAWTSKRWVRAIAWLLLGGLPKSGFQATLEQSARWWRPAGILATLLILGGGATYLSLAQGKGIRGAIVGNLAQLTGAQVDCRSAELSLLNATISVEGLAIADPDDLDRDIVRWEHLLAELDPIALARHELVIERLVLDGAAFDQPRDTTAVTIELAPLPESTREKPSQGREIEWRELMEDGEELERFLERARRGFELLSGEGADADAERRAQEASGVFLPPPPERTALARSRPRIHIIEASLRGLPLEGGRTLSITLLDLSDEPDLIERPTTTTLETSDGDLKFSWSRESAQSWRFRGGGAQVDALRIAKDLGLEETLVAGRVEIELEGVVSSPGARIAGELRVRIHEGRADLGSGPVTLPRDPVVIRLGGQLDDPQFFDRDGSWRRWMTAAARDVLIQEAKQGGLSDLLRKLKKD